MYSRLFLFGAWALFAQGPGPSPSADRIAELRNLGKAFYENPATHKEAAAEFARLVALRPDDPKDRLNYGLALLRAGDTAGGVAQLERVQKQRPDLPHTWFNLGIYWKKFGDTEKALQQMRQFVKLAPHDPPGHYNVGALLKVTGDTAGAIAAFQKTIELDPRAFGPHFQLFNLYRVTGRADDAKRELETFQRLKKEREGDPIPEDLEWSWYSEILDEDQPQQWTPARPQTYADQPVAYQADPASATLTVIAEGLLVASKKGVALVSRSGVVRPIAAAPAYGAAAGDADNDGVSDFAVLTPEGVSLRGKTIDAGVYSGAVWLDYDHDYDQDLLLLGNQSRLLRNEGDNGFRERPFPFGDGRDARSGYLQRVVPDSKAIDVVIRYADGRQTLYLDQLGGVYRAQADKIPADDATLQDDFDGDGRVDLWALQPNGQIVRRRNTTTPAENWITVKLEGVKNAKLAPAAEVEIKAGTLYRKRFYTGAALTFPIGNYKQVDTVRITWPNGLIQNETRQVANKAYTYKEAQRLSGSCPHIWTWNGKEFQYITDVLGVAPLGASSGDGEYFPTDHDEYIQIPKGALQTRPDGRYEIRITEELSEVAYLDEIRLIAVDHPEGTSLYTNDKFKAPPFPEFKLFAAKTKIRPERRGKELRFAKSHGKSLLVLTGWVDWADGSLFAQAAQTKTPLQFPRLEGRQPNGEWKTLVEDMGLPAGKPKTIVVELESAPAEMRIVGNLDVHWTDIFLTPDTAPPAHQLHNVQLANADLHFRGFSAVTIDPQRQQPERFDYTRVSAASLWNPTPGMYTRYGDVTELARTMDDRLIIMGSGDELTLQFQPDSLPPLRPGYQRDFLLKVDGWAKDRDPNTAFSQTVEPLPHHRMSTYPYPASEKHPGGDWIREYNTRPALRLLRPLVSRTR